MSKNKHELLEVADQALAEFESGIVKDPAELGWLEGVEQALRWAAGVGTSAEMVLLTDRVRRVQR